MTAHLADTPTLRTERLVLRAPKGGDWPHWRDFATSQRAEYIGGPYTGGAAWRAFGHIIGHWVMRGWGSFIIATGDDDTPLGSVGPWHPEGWPEAEIGWTIWSPEAEGKGFAFEAAQAARAHAYRDLGWTTAVSYIDAPNQRSIALAERLGAVLDPGAAAPEHGPDAHEVLVYRHPAPEAVL